MKYAQFFTSETTEALGSDQYIYIDGRLSLFNAMEKASEHAKKMNKTLNKGFTHFQIRSGADGSIFTCWRPLSKITKID